MCLLHQEAPCSAILVVLPFSHNPTYQVIKHYLKKCQLSYLLQYPHTHPFLLESCCKDCHFVLIKAEQTRLFMSPLVREAHCFTEQPTVSSLNAGNLESWSWAKLTRAGHNVLHDILLVLLRIAAVHLVLIHLTSLLIMCSSFWASLSILKEKMKGFFQRLVLCAKMS